MPERAIARVQALRGKTLAAALGRGLNSAEVSGAAMPAHRAGHVRLPE